MALVRELWERERANAKIFAELHADIAAEEATDRKEVNAAIEPFLTSPRSAYKEQKRENEVALAEVYAEIAAEEQVVVISNSD